MTGVVLCSDDDLLNFEPNLDQTWPRLDRQGNVKRDWSTQRLLASHEIERRLRGRKDTTEPFEIGRLSDRSKDSLRTCAASLALHYIFVAGDTQGDETGFFARKARLYWEKADAYFETASLSLDYDVDNSGDVDDLEKNQPFPIRFIRG